MMKKKGREGPTLYSYSDSSADQQQRLLNALRDGPNSTIWLRRELDIMMPAARVHELRHGHGVNIQTHRRQFRTEAGYKHSVAEYVLMPGKWQGGAHE